LCPGTLIFRELVLSRPLATDRAVSVPVRPPAFLAMAVLFLSVLPAQASSLSLGQATDYGVFILGNFTGSGTDSQGPMAVGGNFAPATGGFTIASSWSDPAGKYGLVVGGNLTNAGNSLGGGYIYVGGNMAWSDPTAPSDVHVNGTFSDSGGGGSVGGTVYWYGGNTTGSTFTNQQVLTPAASPVDFAAAQSNLDAVSTALAAQSANGATSFDGYYTYTLTGASSTLNVFNLSASDYTSDTINITAPTGSTVVVNVAGSADSFNGGSMNFSGVSAEDVIFNFSTATSVSMAGYSFNATLLAPYAAFTGSYGQIDGQLIAASAQGTTEFHNDPFSGSLPSSATSELSTGFLMLSGAGLVAIARIRVSRTLGRD